MQESIELYAINTMDNGRTMRTYTHIQTLFFL